MLMHKSADVAQSVERRLGKAEVTGSIPVISLKSLIIFQGLFCLYGINIFLNFFNAKIVFFI